MRLILTPEMLARIHREPDDALLGDMIIAARTLERPIKDAKELIGERLDKQKSITSGSGVRITAKYEGGKYTALDPKAIYTGLRANLSDEMIAQVVGYSVTRIKDALAETMDIPKTGKAAITAESVFEARFGHLFEQSQKRKLIFT